MGVKFDVLICGAGPAGSTCGRLLASQGCRVLILDKNRFPRYKPCGGGLTGKSLMELEPGWEKLIEDSTREVIFYHRQKKPVTINYREPVVHMVSRERLDNWLLERAAAAGAVVYDGCLVTEVFESDDGVTVRCQESSTYSGNFLVGADGACSLVRKSLPFAAEISGGIALECELTVADRVLADYQGQVHLSYGGIPGGYGWIFPKGDHLSVGIGSFTREIKGLKQFFYQFCRDMGLSLPEAVRCYGAVIPAANGKAGILHTGHSLLVGDAAGLVDPFSGEGIFYAIRSGRLAAEAIMSTCSDQGGLATYTRMVNNELLFPLRYAGRIARIVYSLTPVVHQLVTTNPDIARRLVEVLFGQDSYEQLWQYLTEQYSLFRLAR